ncbi:MAG: hypothetical protein FJX46_12565 [Alphaproteobacteria bacterium]|nr:hypothetical protein [Alphaproteobacteria bacterium]
MTAPSAEPSFPTPAPALSSSTAHPLAERAERSPFVASSEPDPFLAPAVAPLDPLHKRARPRMNWRLAALMLAEGCSEQQVAETFGRNLAEIKRARRRSTRFARWIGEARQHVARERLRRIDLLRQGAMQALEQAMHRGSRAEQWQAVSFVARALLFTPRTVAAVKAANLAALGVLEDLAARKPELGDYGSLLAELAPRAPSLPDKPSGSGT